MRTGILSSTLLRSITRPAPDELPNFRAALNKFRRIMNRHLKVREFVCSIANSPSMRQAHDTREVRRHLLRPDYMPVPLPIKSVPKADRRAARAQLREMNKWATWRELAQKARTRSEALLTELVHEAEDRGEYHAP